MAIARDTLEPVHLLGFWFGVKILGRGDTMGKFKRISLLGVAASALFCLGFASSANADSFTPTSASGGTITFSSVKVYYVDATASANPWSVTSTCPVGCNANPFGSDASTPFETETVTFTDAANGASQNGLTITGAGALSVYLGNPSGSSIFASGNTDNPMLVNVGATAGWATQVGNSWCGPTGCNNAGASLKLVSEGALGDVFVLTDDSFALAFQLGSATTPEPSSLLMLGSGLLGLMGLGLRRKGII